MIMMSQFFSQLNDSFFVLSRKSFLVFSFLTLTIDTNSSYN